MSVNLNSFEPKTDNPADMETLTEAVNDQYTYHPWTDAQIEAGKHVVHALKAAAHAICNYVPASPDRSVALRKLREARMDANSAITHGGRY